MGKGDAREADHEWLQQEGVGAAAIAISIADLFMVSSKNKRLRCRIRRELELGEVHGVGLHNAHQGAETFDRHVQDEADSYGYNYSGAKKLNDVPQVDDGINRRCRTWAMARVMARVS